MFAFVLYVTPLSSSSFLPQTASPICPRVAEPTLVTMRLKQTIKDKGYEVVKPGQSKWIDSPYTGGFPGGEEGLYQWLAEGAKDDVPEVPENLQPRNEQNREDDYTKERVCNPYLGYCWDIDWMDKYCHDDPLAQECKL